MECEESHKTKVVEDFENDQHFLQLWAELSRNEEEQRDLEEKIKKTKEELEKRKKEILKQKASRKLQLGVTENYQSYSKERPDTEVCDFQENVTSDESLPSPRYEENDLLESETLTYEKKHGVVDTSGYMYEVKVCALIFLKLINLGAKFYMCNNFTKAGVFDDIVVKYSYMNECGEVEHHSLFLQLKHVTSDKEKTLSFLEGDFQLEKYFRSFCQTQSKVLPGHEIFSTDPSDRQYVVFTNGNVKKTLLSEDDSPSWFVDSISTGDILVVCDNKMETELEVYKQFCCIAKNLLNNENDANYEKQMAEFLKTSKCKYLKESWKRRKGGKDAEALKVEHIDLDKLPSFLSSLKICIKQSNVKEVNSYIKNEIKSFVGPVTQGETELVFRKLVGEIETWRKESNYYLTEKWRKWNEIVTENEYSRFTIKSEELSKLAVRFQETYLEKLQKILSKSNFLILVSDATDTTVLCLKIWQILEKSYKKRYIFLKVKEFLNSKNILWKMWPVRWCEIIVVDCEGCKNFDGLSKNIKRVRVGKKDCRVTLISTQSQYTTNVSFEEHEFIKYREPSYLYQLDSDSQTLLTDKQINFQGKLMTVKDILPIEIAKDINSDALTYFIFNDVIILGRDIRELQTSEYVERNLSLPCVSEDIFKGNELEAVLAVEINEDTSALETYKKLTLTAEELLKKCSCTKNQDFHKVSGCVVLTPGREEEDFEDICNVCPNVSWFKHDSEKLLLVKTKGDINMLRKYLKEEIIEFSEANLIEECQNPKIITAVSGMGKTSLLHHLALLLKDRYPSKWVVVIHLLDHCEYLSKVKIVDKQCVVDIIKHALELNSVEALLFTECANNLKSFVVLVDGFDEIAPSFTEITTQIIKLLSDMCFYVVVTSRPSHKAYLETNYSVISYTLEPFTKDMKTDFLSKVLNKTMHGTEHATLITQVLKQYDRINDRSGNLLTDNPLLLKMLVKTYESSEKSSDNDVPYNNYPMNILQLYDGFVTEKINILFREKKRSDIYNPLVQQDFDKFKAEFLHFNKEICARQIFGSGCFSTEQRNYTDSNIYKYLRNERENLIKTGIVLDVSSDGKVNYIHRSFAEYFSALWLADNYKDYLSIFQRVHREQEFDLVLLFFNLKNSTNNVLHISLLSGNPDIAWVLTKNTHALIQKDAIGRTLLHLTSMYNNVKYTKILISETISLCTVEGLKDDIGWNPLKYAVITFSFDVLDLILSKKSLATETTYAWEDLRFMVHEIIYESILNNYQNILLLASRHTDLNAQYLIHERAKTKHSPLSKYKCTCSTFIPLHLATEHNEKNIFKLLVSVGCDVTIKDEEGYSLLHIACCNGDLDLVKYLLHADVDKNCYTKTSKLTSLHMATLENHVEIVRELIKYGTNIHCETAKGETTLMVACKLNSIELVKLYVEAGSRIDGKVLTLASKFGNPLILDILFAPVSKAQDKYWKETYLAEAIKQGNFENVKYYINRGVNANSVYLLERAPALFVSEAGNTKILEYLVEHGSDISYIDRFGNTALICAVYSGNIETVKYCVEKGLDVNHVNKNGNTPVLIASMRGHADILKYLVEHGADMSYVNSHGYTAVTCAAYSGNIETVKYCVEKGLDVNNVQNNDNIPVLIASALGHADILKYLVENGPDISYTDSDGHTVLTHAVYGDNIETVKYCVEKGLDVNHVTNNGYTPVLLASALGHAYILKYLVENGADISYIDIDGNTVLTHAVYGGNIETVKYCVEKGLDVNHVTKNGYTLVRIASDRGHTDILKYLVELGADFSDINSDFKTALPPNVHSNIIKIIKFCKKKGLDVNHVMKNAYTHALLASESELTDILKILEDTKYKKKKKFGIF